MGRLLNFPNKLNKHIGPDLFDDVQACAAWAQIGGKHNIMLELTNNMSKCSLVDAGSPDEYYVTATYRVVLNIAKMDEDNCVWAAQIYDAPEGNLLHGHGGQNEISKCEALATAYEYVTNWINERTQS